MGKINNSFFYIAVLIICAVLFNLLPFFVSGVPLQEQLLSDAESHMVTWQAVSNPKIIENDKILQPGISALPSGQVISGRLFVFLANRLSIDLFLWSVILSFFALSLFLCGLYVLMYYSLGDRLSAFLVSFFSIIPVHCLGGSTFGFPALGFLPRDLSLALAMPALLVYFRGVRHEDKKYISAAFLAFGILANFYPSLFANIAIVLIIAEFIRTKKVGIIYFLYGGIFLLGAVPAIADFMAKSYKSAPIDINIMRSYYGYMMVSSFTGALTRYLRRFIIYVILNTLIYLFVARGASKHDRALLRPFYAIAISSFVFSVIGVYIESTTVFAKYLVSRASLWFTLSSMAIAAYGIGIFFKKYAPRRAGLLTLIVVSAIFIGQSNIATSCRFLKNAHDSAAQKREFHIAVSKLNDMTKEGDVILAPSEEYSDLAASVRTYSYRPIYVCYKYGGISIMDGNVAREWLERYDNLQKIFEDFDSKKLIDFMEQEKIQYAFIPISYYSQNDRYLSNFIIADTGHYIIVRK